MPLLSKSNLLKDLKLFSSFDSETATPFVGVKLEGDFSYLKRTSPYGQTYSTYFNLINVPTTYVSLSHFLERLRVLEDKVMVEVDLNGVLRLTGMDAAFTSELRVHTVHECNAGLKEHDEGPMVAQIKPEWFQGFNSHPFKLAVPPVLSGGRIMLATSAGIVFWKGSPELEQVEVNPRESFVNFISSGQITKDSLGITKKGYWVGEAEGRVVVCSTHTMGQQLFDSYCAIGKPTAKLPSARLMYVLRAAANLAGENGKVEFDPTEGVVVRDSFGNPSRFTLGIVNSWRRFSITNRTAKLIVDALAQATDEETELQILPFNTPTLRLSRGDWECNFKYF